MDRDRRKYARQTLSCPALIFDKHKRLIVKGKTVDVSVGGVKILGPAGRVPEVADQVQVDIELQLPGTAKVRDFKRQAVVRRVDRMGDWTAVAVEFAPAADESEVLKL